MPTATETCHRVAADSSSHEVIRQRRSWLAHATLSTTATNASTANLSSSDLINRYERRFLLGTAAFDSPPPPRQLNTPIATISAATNTCLMRRRNHNAYNPTLPLQHNTPRLVADILQLVAQTATAMRTTAQLEDRYIYTHYEGWMPPDEGDWPTNV